LSQIVQQHPQLTTDGKFLLCGVCSQSIVYDAQHGADGLKTHLRSSKHLENLKISKSKQQTIFDSMKCASNDFKVRNNFNHLITKSFVEANIPLYKINHPSIKTMLEQCSGQRVPDESTLRKTCVPSIFADVIEKIRQDIGIEDVVVIVDESTDVEQRYILNIFFGKLNGTISKPMLAYSKSTLQFLKQLMTVSRLFGLNKCNIAESN